MYLIVSCATLIYGKISFVIVENILTYTDNVETHSHFENEVTLMYIKFLVLMKV